MNEESFISFVTSISENAAQKMVEEKITPDLVNQMSDEELSVYIPRHGDRIRLRTELRKKAAQKKKQRLLTLLQEKLQKARKKESETEDNEEMRNPHRPFGNRNAAKSTRVVELGWIHKSNKRTIQVRRNKGGGTRKTELPKTALKAEILEEAISLFFPGGTSPKGPASNFDFDLWDFSDRPIDDDVSVQDMYERTKMPLLRFYLSTFPKIPSDPTPVDDHDQESDTSGNIPTSPQMSNIITIPLAASKVEHQDTIEHQDTMEHQDTKKDNNNGDILSNAMEIAGLPINISDDDNDDDCLPDLGFPSAQPSTVCATKVKEHTLKLHRGHLLQEFISSFKNIDPTKDIVTIQMVMPDGRLEAAEDGGGVTRDALTDFWTTFYDQCTLGTKFKIPVLRHDFAEKEWESVANIIVFGWKSCGYFPVQLSQPFLELSLYGKVTSPILDSFFEVIPEDEAITLKKALSDVESIDEEDLLDILQLHDTKTLPTKQNISRILNEIAHKEIIQTPMFIVDCFHPVLKHLGISEDRLAHLYSDLIPTPKVVSRMLKFPEPLCADEQTVTHHLRRLIREMNNETLRKFLRFCTGSDLIINKEIKVSFVNVSGLARRPVAHTCSCLLELSKCYESFPQFRSEFMAVLESNVWVMDII